MKQFLAVYTGTPASFEKWKTMDEAERKKREEKGMKAWMDWGATHASATVVEGGPLGKTKRASTDGITDIKNNLSGYIVIEAASHDEAAKMFENHPHFTIFPGDAVEIMECLPIPGM
ncbi:hypothetical protein PUV54_09490 [Hyphococcus flavus]|uniref:YCII-related domain-containing protein n=1 Tax=Hyphococcus flavus TaxID=1866326 RepID=A0AAF0CG11_9PROT|nr:hypothetical protein [Hyphococcus flavus]WDI30192.1 hypothetical protein PUV54_09490 [Hyphococcus flavus]